MAKKIRGRRSRRSPGEKSVRPAATSRYAMVGRSVASSVLLFVSVSPRRIRIGGRQRSGHSHQQINIAASLIKISAVVHRWQISMREYVLTNNERRILKQFLSTGDKLQGFSMLVFRARQSGKRLADDLALLQRVLKKTESVRD